MAGLTRRADRSSNIWPGFVDALATLLMVIMFLLLIFVLAQFFLSEALSGREQALDKLKVQVSELAELLSLEEKTNSDMRANLSQLSAELQTSVALRDELRTSVSLLQKNAIDDGETIRKLKSESTAAFAEMLSLRENLTASELQVSLLRKNLSASELAVSDIRKNLNTSQQQISELDKDLETSKKKNAELSENLDVFLQENSQLSENLDTSQQKNSELSESLDASQQEISKLRLNLGTAEDNLSTVREKSTSDAALITALNDQLKRDKRVISLLQQRLSEAETRISILQKRSADAEQTISKLDSEVAANKINSAEARMASQEQLQKIAALTRQIQLLEALKQEMQSKISEMAGKLSESGKSLLSEKEFSESARAEVALLNQQMSALRAQLAQIRLALEISEEEAEEKNVQIANLGKRLNAALASKVQELSRYRSEFFGRLRRLLGNRQEVHIVGDRFVFQSEVLFAKGEAEIGLAGQDQLDQLATTLLEIAIEIPGEIDWVLRVDGHTDNDPINTARYPSNWELSTARAISVVKHLVNAGLPANRLVAAGFGEFHPIDKRHDENSKRQNRRIELKLTQR